MAKVTIGIDEDQIDCIARGLIEHTRLATFDVIYHLEDDEGDPQGITRTAGAIHTLRHKRNWIIETTYPPHPVGKRRSRGTCIYVLIWHPGMDTPRPALDPLGRPFPGGPVTTDGPYPLHHSEAKTITPGQPDAVATVPIVQCPVTGCTRFLGAVQSTTALNIWKGLCLDHGKQTAVARPQ